VGLPALVEQTPLEEDVSMTHDEAFIQTILDAPKDDYPRLVYADWLEERGETRTVALRSAACSRASRRRGFIKSPGTWASLPSAGWDVAGGPGSYGHRLTLAGGTRSSTTCWRLACAVGRDVLPAWRTRRTPVSKLIRVSGSKPDNAPLAKEVERRAKYFVSPEKFVLAWNDSESADEVAERLGMTKPIVLARVSAYRKKGVHLKKMRKTRVVWT
jgi:uncharacterized protein (TIGR02996 family)